MEKAEKTLEIALAPYETKEYPKDLPIFIVAGKWEARIYPAQPQDMQSIALYISLPPRPSSTYLHIEGKTAVELFEALSEDDSVESDGTIHLGVQTGIRPLRLGFPGENDEEIGFVIQSHHSELLSFDPDILRGDSERRNASIDIRMFEPRITGVIASGVSREALRDGFRVLMGY